MPYFITFNKTYRKFDLRPSLATSVGTWKIKVILTLDRLVHSKNVWTLVVKPLPVNNLFTTDTNTAPKWTYPGNDLIVSLKDVKDGTFSFDINKYIKEIDEDDKIETEVKLGEFSSFLSVSP
jgi:hypothetical protein